MKKSSLLSLLFVFAIACNSEKTELTAGTAFNQETEKAAILKTIEAETSAFYQRDYEGWKKNYVQTEYAFQAWNNDDGTFDAKVGWPEVDKKIGDYIKEHPLEPGATASHPKVERRNMIVKFYTDSLAYLVWDQYNSDTEVKNYTHSKEERIMEKHTGEWKIANVSAYWDYKNTIPVDSLK